MEIYYSDFHSPAITEMKLLNKILPVLRRLPFTISLVIILGLMALITNTHIRPLSLDWLNMLGFGAHDLWYLRLERLLTSAVVTQGGKGFWGALAMLACSVGLAEWLAGTPRTLLTFISVHIITLVIEAFLIGLAQPFNNQQALALFWVRDVGPSAGYFGCLGLACASLPHPWRWLSAGMILLILTTSLFLPASPGESVLVKISADIAHVLAFPLGFALTWIKPFRRIHLQEI
jgi:hypothetical protein